MNEKAKIEEQIKQIYEVIGRLVFSDNPHWVWLMENQTKLQKLLDADK